MMIAKPKMFSLSMPSAVSDAVRALFSVRDGRTEIPIATPKLAGPDLDPFHQDRSRYVRVLEKELDRQILTQVEREDTDLLDRVRFALYAD